MKIPKAPLNNLYVTIEKKFYDTYAMKGGITLYKDTTFHPEENAMIIAKVASIPKLIQDRYDYQGLTCPIKCGDTILMRYDVVFAYADQPDRETPRYKNVLLYNGQEYWKVDIQKVFAVKRGPHWRMVNGYVLCEPYSYKIEKVGSILVPEISQDQEADHTLRVRYIGDPLPQEPEVDVLHGELIHVRPGVAQRYEIDGWVFYIIRQSHILGKPEVGYF